MRARYERLLTVDQRPDMYGSITTYTGVALSDHNLLGGRWKHTLLGCVSEALRIAHQDFTKFSDPILTKSWESAFAEGGPKMAHLRMRWKRFCQFARLAL